MRKLISETAQNDIKPEKILGALWDEIDDTFIFDFKEIAELSEILSVTKRNILKILAMFFDPIGILQPLVINFKILFQKVCKEKFDWDEVISEELQEEWKIIMNSFKLIGKLKVSRKIVSLDDVDQLEKLTISVNLVTSKSRPAPIKGPIIPRLELLGNLLLSRLMDSVEKSLSKILSISEVFLWIESQITLVWIRAENKEFQTFVENRVQEIRKLTVGITVTQKVTH